MAHWDEIRHGAGAEVRKRALRAKVAEVAVQSGASEAAREAESCALLVELAANEMKVALSLDLSVK